MNITEQQICIACQECCKWLTFTIQCNNYTHKKELVDYYKAHQFVIVVDDYKIQVMIPTKCPQLTKWGCKIYNNRPEMCLKYDGRKDPLLKALCKLNDIK